MTTTNLGRARSLRILALGLLFVASCGGSGGSGSGSGPSAPTKLAYGSDPVLYPLGLAIPPNVPSVQGQVTGWSITPALPAGLSLNTQTGVISGTPGVLAASKTYVVQAANSSGAATTGLELGVVLPSSFAVTGSLGDDTLTVHLANARTGQLRPWSYTAAGPGEENPGRLVTSPDGKVVYAVDRDGDAISIYDLDLEVGRLVARAPLATDPEPFELALHPDGTAAYLTLVGSDEVQAYDVDPLTGDLTPLGAPLATSGEPRALVIGATGDYLYVANSIVDTLQTFSIDPLTRALSPTGVEVPTGIAPLAMAVTNDARHLFIVNAVSSTLSFYNLNLQTGQPTNIEERFVGQLPVDVELDPTTRFVYVAVSGDNVVRAYRFFSNVATLSEVGTALPAGQQPSRIEVDAAGRFMYVANTSSDDISQFSIDLVSGALTPVEHSNTRDQPVGFALLSGDAPSLPQAAFAYVANSGSGDLSMFTVDSASGVLASVGTPQLVGTLPRALACEPFSRFLYSVDGSGDSLHGFSIDPVSGQLSSLGAPLATGAGPRAVVVDRSGRFLYVADQGGDSVSRFSLDLASGVASAAGSVPVGSDPVALALDPTGRFLYVANQGDDTLSTFAISPLDGSLSAVGSPLSVGDMPLALAAQPAGRYLMATFGTAGELSVHALDSGTGAPSPGLSAASGTEPSAVAVDPLGRRAFVSNQQPLGVGDVATFDLDPLDGQPTSSGTTASGVNPIDLGLDPSGAYLYVCSTTSDDVSVFDVSDPLQGPVLVGTWAVGVAPVAIAVAGKLLD